ncbi:MAG: ADP-L-glycero-D-manno-heptose 6-epimerase [Candidatus Marinamargulisbacteria bacterium]|jgi:ADP-L-glycero-D-manno-heptose 6-epimerase
MIIVTGGAGFIGSAFIWKCNQEGIRDIIIVDDLNTSDKWENLIGLSYSDYIHKSVFSQMVSENKLDLKVDAIIHMGACSATTETDADYLMENNYRYTKLLCNWALANNARFIYASSGATYGGGENGFSDSHGLLQDLAPINRYGYSKHFFDLVAQENDWLDKIVGLKFFNVFGPNEYHKGDMKSVICKAYRQILDDGEIRLFKSYNDKYPNGGQLRDFVYVKDCVDIMWWFMHNPEKNGIFNVGTGQARTWNDLAKSLFSAMKTDPNISYIDMPDSLRNQYQYYTKAEIKKLEEVGCPIKCRALEEAVDDYVKGYLAPQRHLS